MCVCNVYMCEIILLAKLLLYVPSMKTHFKSGICVTFDFGIVAIAFAVTAAAVELNG